MLALVEQDDLIDEECAEHEKLSTMQAFDRTYLLRR